MTDNAETAAKCKCWCPFAFGLQIHLQTVNFKFCLHFQVSKHDFRDNWFTHGQGYVFMSHISRPCDISAFFKRKTKLRTKVV